LHAPQDIDKIEVSSLQGDLLISSVGNTVSLSSLSKGIYIVRSFEKGNSHVNKVVKN